MSVDDSYSAHAEVQQFLSEDKDKYNRLLSDVKILLEKLKTDLAASQIVEYYTRIDNRGQFDEFKNFDKLVFKLVQWRRLYGEETQTKDIHDIIGTTIVVFYESDIQYVYEIIEENCKAFNLSIVRYKSGEFLKRYTKFGYHAHHIVLTSLSPMLKGFKCEVQIKTLLHDAWQKKTHELIYKPQGELGEEHRQIMESFGESIQAIEVQSQTIRKLISQEWQDDDELRYLARTQLNHWLEKRDFYNASLESEYRNILNQIIGKRKIIKGCNITDIVIVGLIEKISSLAAKEDGIEAAWPLMVYMSSVRQDNHLHHIAKQYVRDWLKNNDDAARNCLYLSFTYYTINERSEAIREIENFLRNDLETSSSIHRKLKFNLLYYLIEEASSFLKRKNELQAKCDYWLAELKKENWEDLPQANIQDTKGYYLIVFGENHEQIKEGIRKCQAAHANEPIVARYLELHEAIGWRRYLNARRRLTYE